MESGCSEVLQPPNLGPSISRIDIIEGCYAHLTALGTGSGSESERFSVCVWEH